jgi:hypothetical protein
VITASKAVPFEAAWARGVSRPRAGWRLSAWSLRLRTRSERPWFRMIAAGLPPRTPSQRRSRWLRRSAVMILKQNCVSSYRAHNRVPFHNER